MPDNCIAIINRLIEQRHNIGMTQKELAEATNLTQSVIARLESKKNIPQLDTLLKVANALGCKILLVPEDMPLPDEIGIDPEKYKDDIYNLY